MRRSRMLGGIALAVASLLAVLAVPASALLPPPVGHAAGVADRQVGIARAATRDFTHPPAARKAGYALLKDAQGIACISMKGMPGMQGMKGMGGMGVHYANGARVDGRIQVRHPEALVYRFTRNGHLELSALEYLVTRHAWRTTHPTGRPALFGHRFNFTPHGNRFGLPAYFSLHAWLWDDNPAGTYTMWNPGVHCPAGI